MFLITCNILCQNNCSNCYRNQKKPPKFEQLAPMFADNCTDHNQPSQFEEMCENIRFKSTPQTKLGQLNLPNNILAQNQPGTLALVINSMSQVTRKQQQLVLIEQPYQLILNQLTKNTLIISGTAKVGKATGVYWAAHNHQDRDIIKIIEINCLILNSEAKIDHAIGNQLQHYLIEQGIIKSSVREAGFKYDYWNPHLKKNQYKFVFLLKGAEKLVEYKRQSLLYNILDWMKTEARFKVSFIFSVRTVIFVQKFEKRIKSRLSGVFVNIMKIKTDLILKILTQRLECLINDRQLLEFQKPSNNELVPQKKVSKKKRERVKSMPQVMLKSQVAQFCQRVKNAMKTKQFQKLVSNFQGSYQRNIIYYLNCARFALCSQFSEETCLYLTQEIVTDKILSGFSKAFKNISQNRMYNLLKSKFIFYLDSTIPEKLTMSIIRYMCIHDRSPFNLKNLYTIYTELEDKMVPSSGLGSSSKLSKYMLEKALRKLSDMEIVSLELKDNIWNAEFCSYLYETDIYSCLSEEENLPALIYEILDIA